MLEKFQQYGFYKGNVVIKKDEVLELREKLENIFKKKNYPRTISLFEINDKDLIRTILDIYSSPEIKKFLLDLEKTHKENLSFLPKFIIQRNYHVDRLSSPGIGWHRDCGGELQHDYCNKILSKNSYVFGKLGIYLQENSLFGGSIDVIPKSHKYIKLNKKIMRKIQNIKLSILMKIQKYFPNLYKIFSENFYMKLLKAERVNPKPGSFILFDSRLIHRGSPIDDRVRLTVDFQSKDFFAAVPEHKTKFSLYVDIGSATALDSYLYDRNEREEDSKYNVNAGASEIESLKKELSLLQIFKQDLAIEIKKNFQSTFEKYS